MMKLFRIRVAYCEYVIPAVNAETAKEIALTEFNKLDHKKNHFVTRPSDVHYK